MMGGVPGEDLAVVCSRSILLLAQEPSAEAGMMACTCRVALRAWEVRKTLAAGMARAVDPCHSVASSDYRMKHDPRVAKLAQRHLGKVLVRVAPKSRFWACKGHHQMRETHLVYLLRAHHVWRNRLMIGLDQARWADCLVDRWLRSWWEIALEAP